MKKNILKYIIEFLIVTFGVFLGTYVNNLQSKKKTNLEKKRSLSHIFKELESNEKTLETSIEYIESTKEEFDSISKALRFKDVMNSSFFDNIYFSFEDFQCWNGFNPIGMGDTAFETAKINEIVKEYDIDLLQDISKVYNHQKFYKEYQNTIMNHMVTNFNYSTSIGNIISLFEMNYGDVLANQKHLLETIKEFKKENSHLIER